MENFVISPDGYVLRWTCTRCQHDNIFALNFPLYPDEVKWRCEGCSHVTVVYQPRKWMEEAMSSYMKIHREGETAKLGKLGKFDPENIARSFNQQG